MPKVSVIIPNYNHSEFLKRRIESVLNQTFQDFELILLDDCSTDSSIEVLRTYESHPKTSNLVLNTENSGSPFKQWQKGINLAKGEYIWIAESDDYCELNFLEELFSLNTNNEFSVLYAQSYDVDSNEEIIHDRVLYTKVFAPNIWEETFRSSGKDFVDNYLKVKNVIPNASAVIFKAELIGTSVFDEEMLEMRMCGDWLFWIKIISKSNVLFLSKHLNYFRNHASVSRNHVTNEKRKRRLIEEKGVRECLSTFNVSQEQEVKILYKNWRNLSSNLFQIKLKSESVRKFLKNYFF